MTKRNRIAGCLLTFLTLHVLAGADDTHYSTVDNTSNCGYIKSLRMETLSSVTYAVVITSSPDRIGLTNSYVGGDDEDGGYTYIALPSDATEKALIWASLDRALHNTQIRLYWKKATTGNTLVPATTAHEILLQEWVLSTGLP